MIVIHNKLPVLCREENCKGADHLITEKQKGQRNAEHGITIPSKNCLPITVSMEKAGEFAGDTVYWHCSGCGAWRHSVIDDDGGVQCPACGGTPDWSKSTRPRVAYSSRNRKVNELCTSQDWLKNYMELENRYADFIDAVEKGLPRRTKQNGFRYFHRAWKELDSIADYLLKALDSPNPENTSAYTERGLKRKYFDTGRLTNTNSLSEMDLPTMNDEGDDVTYTDEELAENMSFRAGHSAPFYEWRYNIIDWASNVTDRTERAIIFGLAEGKSKRDIEREYELTEKQVRTKIAHLAKVMGRE